MAARTKGPRREPTSWGSGRSLMARTILSRLMRRAERMTVRNVRTRQECGYETHKLNMWREGKCFDGLTDDGGYGFD